MFALDDTTNGLILIYDRLAGTSLMDKTEMAKLQSHIRERREMVHLGVLKCPTWFQEELTKLDFRMRAWWDSQYEQWVLDRLQDEGYYLTIIRFKPEGRWQLDHTLIEGLRANDMQRFSSPKEYIEKKRAAAELKQKQNEDDANNVVLAAVDSMSSKQLKQMIAVEEAMATGDTIHYHGEDLKIMERAQEEYQRQGKEAEARGEKVHTFRDDEDKAMNPGMHPKVYKRERTSK